MKYLQYLQKALFHKDFLRWRTWLRSAALFPLEYHIFKRVMAGPRVVNFLPTLRCNQNCAICHSRDILCRTDRDEMDLETIFSFIDDCRHYSPDFHLSGGEPMMRRDLFCIVNHIHSRGMRVSMISNGQLWTEKRILEFDPGSLPVVTFSLLGVGEDHDREVASAGAYENVLAAIRRLRELRPHTKVYVNCPITFALLKRLPQLGADLFKLGVKGVKLAHLNFLTPTEEQDHQVLMESLGYSCTKAYSWITGDDFRTHPQLIKNAVQGFPLPFQFIPQLNEEESLSWYSQTFCTSRPCHFLWHSTYVFPDGTVKPCHFLQEPMGNIKDQPLDIIFKGEKYHALRSQLRNKLFPGCSRCCKL